MRALDCGAKPGSGRAPRRFPHAPWGRGTGPKTLDRGVDPGTLDHHAGPKTPDPGMEPGTPDRDAGSQILDRGAGPGTPGSRHGPQNPGSEREIRNPELRREPRSFPDAPWGHGVGVVGGGAEAPARPPCRAQGRASGSEV